MNQIIPGFQVSTLMLATLSALFLLAGTYISINKAPSKMSLVFYSLAAFVSIVLFITYAAAYYFTGNGIDEATIYHLKYGLDGAGFGEYYQLIVATLLVLAAVFIALVYLFRRASHTMTSRGLRFNEGAIDSLLLYFLMALSVALNPAVIDIYKLETRSSASLSSTDPGAYSDFYEFYRKPYIGKSPEKPKNIVFVYAESLERTYFNEDIFPGLIKGLRTLEAKSTYFTNIKQADGTSWTVGGMTSSQCGIPLFTPSHGNSMRGMDQFLASAVCLGDLLRDNGYHLAYYGGSKLEFAGKGKLLRTHGFTDINGTNSLLPQLADTNYKTDWGLYDDSLFGIVSEQFLKLSQAGETFGLFALTLDTHHPVGHPSKSCDNIEYANGNNPILNAVACSDYLITNFVNGIINSPYANDTVIVLVSDHLAMRNTASDLLGERRRRNLFMIIDPSRPQVAEIQTLGSTLDIGPTVLNFIGHVGEIGLGRNLLENQDQIETESAFIQASLTRWDAPIKALWDFPKISEAVEINLESEMVRVDDREFGIPILIELNERLETILRFEFNSAPGHDSLAQHRRALDESRYFLLIDQCEHTRIVDTLIGDRTYCLSAGQGRKYFKIMKLNQNTTLTTNEIYRLLNMASDS